MNMFFKDWSCYVVICFLKDEVEGSLDFKYVELLDFLCKGVLLLSKLNVKVSSG